MPITCLVLVLASPELRVAKLADPHTLDQFNCGQSFPNRSNYAPTWDAITYRWQCLNS